MSDFSSPESSGDDNIGRGRGRARGSHPRARLSRPGTPVFSSPSPRRSGRSASSSSSSSGHDVPPPETFLPGSSSRRSPSRRSPSPGHDVTPAERFRPRSPSRRSASSRSPSPGHDVTPAEMYRPRSPSSRLASRRSPSPGQPFVTPFDRYRPGASVPLSPRSLRPRGTPSRSSGSRRPRPISPGAFGRYRSRSPSSSSGEDVPPTGRFANLRGTPRGPLRGRRVAIARPPSPSSSDEDYMPPRQSSFGSGVDEVDQFPVPQSKWKYKTPSRRFTGFGDQSSSSGSSSGLEGLRGRRRRSASLDASLGIRRLGGARGRALQPRRGFGRGAAGGRLPQPRPTQPRFPSSRGGASIRPPGRRDPGDGRRRSRIFQPRR